MPHRALAVSHEEPTQSSWLVRNSTLTMHSCSMGLVSLHHSPSLEGSAMRHLYRLLDLRSQLRGSLVAQRMSAQFVRLHIP